MIDLQRFCSETNKRVDKPFVVNGFKYATDLMVMVAIKTDEPNSEGCHLKKTNELFERSWDEGWEPEIIIQPRESEHDCRFCNGKGTRHFVCEICEGGGWHKCECGNEHKCGYCEGGYFEYENDENCLKCEGTGKAFENQRYGITYFPGHHLAMIAKHLPNPRVTEISTKSHTLRFEFDGGKGLLMGTKEDSYEVDKQ